MRILAVYFVVVLSGFLSGCAEEFQCSVDYDCPGAQVCNVDSGACEAFVCEADEDCKNPTQRCQKNACVAGPK